MVEVDPDIAGLNLKQLQQLYMRRRNEARDAVKTLMAEGNDNCWDDMLKAIQSLLPEHEHTLWSLGKFKMTEAETLGFCKKWIAYQKNQGNILPNNDSE